MPLFKVMSVIGLFVVYISLIHIALLAADPGNIWRHLAILLLLAPIVAILTWAVAAYAKKLALARALIYALPAAACVTMVAASLAVWPLLLTRLDWIYLAQHTASNLLLGWFFARTLFNQRVPLVTTLALSVHGTLPETILRYTRGVTIAWSIFFAAQVVISLFIFYFLSIETWSLFANVLNWPQVIAMFIGEYLSRKIIHPDFQHASIRESIAAFMNQKNKA